MLRGAASKFDTNSTTEINLLAGRWILFYCVTVAVRFELQTELRTHAHDVTHALFAQVRHHCGTIVGDGEYDFFAAPIEILHRHLWQRRLALLLLPLNLLQALR